jgi:hypothetical protein
MPRARRAAPQQAVDVDALLGTYGTLNFDVADVTTRPRRPLRRP